MRADATMRGPPSRPWGPSGTRAGSQAERPRRRSRVATPARWCRSRVRRMGTTEQITIHDKLYMGGEWLPPSSESTIDVVNPANERVIARIPAGTADDVDRAVAAARETFETWSRTSVDERAAQLESV